MVKQFTVALLTLLILITPLASHAQTRSTLAGKILRYNPDGSIPGDNPFPNSPIFALGLRNSFDFTFHPTTGIIYATENGPDGDDKINRIVAGGNYGWRPGYPCGDMSLISIAPIVRFTPTIAPTGITFYTGDQYPEYRGDLFFVDFNLGNIWRLRLTGENLDRVDTLEVFLDGSPNRRFGALPDIVTGPDGNLYFSSFNATPRIVKRI
jgi:glucose/arabinose dehydrogenase